MFDVFFTKSNGLENILYFYIRRSSGVYDRILYNAVPDFIDFHVNNFHWFIFNIADIFITIGVLWLILAEFFVKKKYETN